MERNLAAMAAHAAAAGLALRPHAKTHKSGWVARRQRDHGAVGLTVATLHEAEVFAQTGLGDLLIAFPPAGGPRLRRLAELARAIPRLAVSLDDVELAAGLPESVEVLWEIDTGLHRVGTEPGQATAQAVRRLVQLIGQNRFRGLLTHGGHAYRGQREAAAGDERSGLIETAELLRRDGIEVRELSVGSTPTAQFARAGSGLTEMRPGTYVFGDANQVALGSCQLAGCALAVVATVVSSHSDRFIVDAGSKALPADLLVPALQGLGIVLGRPELRLSRLSEEHAVVEGGPAKIGERLVILPAHACTAVNLHPALLVFGASETRWEPVTARGWR